MPDRFHHRMSNRPVPSHVIEDVAPTTQVSSCCAYLHGLFRPLCQRAMSAGWARPYRTASPSDAIFHLRQHVLFRWRDTSDPAVHGGAGYIPRRVVAHAVMVTLSRSC